MLGKDLRHLRAILDINCVKLEVRRLAQFLQPILFEADIIVVVQVVNPDNLISPLKQQL